MKSTSKPDPKLVESGEDLPWVWCADAGRGDLTVSEKNGAYVG